MLTYSQEKITPTVTSSKDSESDIDAQEPSSSGGLQCESECCQDSLDIFQVRDSTILKKTRRDQGQRSRQFCCDWYTAFPWLVLCVTHLKAFCAYCRYAAKRGLLTDKLSDNAFISNGFNNWKKALERFEQHAQSSSHKEALLKIELLEQPTIVSQLNSQQKKEQKIRREMLLITLSSLKFLVRQGLPVRGHEEIEGNLMQLLLLRSQDCAGLRQYIDNGNYLSHDVINEMITLMSNKILRELLAEIREAEIFSLIADEATDVCNKEQLCITIRWVNQSFEIYETPVELINVPKTDSDTLTMLIKDCLIRLGLPIGQCRGQTYDGAANMSGHIHGVAANLQQLESTAIYVHCLAHCTNLCLKTVGRLSECVHDVLELVMGLSQLILYSPKRSSLFETLRSQVSPGAPTLKPLCPTRWTVRTRAIGAILSNYELLMDALEMIQKGKDEYAMKANGYLNSMQSFRTFFGLKLSYLIFSATEQLSLSLQGKDTTIQEAIQAGTLAKHFLERQRTDTAFDSFYSLVLTECKNLTTDPALPRQRRPPKRIDSGTHGHVFSDPKSYFRKFYLDALDIIISELNVRFNQHRGLPIAAKLEKVLLEAANHGMSGLTEGLPKELDMYSKDLDSQHLLVQLQMLPDLIRTYNESHSYTAVRSVTSLRTLCEIMNTVTVSRSMFDQVSKLLKIVLTVPVTSSTAERSFSTLRRLKTYIRSTMAQKRLNNLMLLHIHKGKTDSLDVLTIAKDFIEKNERRLAFFGRF